MGSVPSRAGFPGWSPLLEEKAAVPPGERGRDRGMGTSCCTRDLGVPLELPGQAGNRNTGVLGKGNPRSCSCRASG